MTMIIARFMKVSLGYARIQVNTWRRGKDDKGLGPRFMVVLSPGRIGLIRGRRPAISNLGKISGDQVIGRGIAARTSVILKSLACDHLFRRLPRVRRLPLQS